MLEVYRHGGAGRHGASNGAVHHHHSSTAIQPYRPLSGFGNLHDWTDVLIPRGDSSSSSFNVWELSPNKLKTAAVAFTFVVTAGYISMLAAGGLLAILVTGAVVTCCVLLTVLTCATLITLIVTGVPVGYAIIRLIMSARNNKSSSRGNPLGGGGGFFSGMFGGGGGDGQSCHMHEEHEERGGHGNHGSHATHGSHGTNGFHGYGGFHGTGFGARPHAGNGGGWHYRPGTVEEEDED